MTAYPTAARIAELFDVDVESGRIWWKRSRGNRLAGAEAGSDHIYGYRVVNIDGRGYQVHSLIWFCATGDWPELIDHINGKRNDNRIANLRAADAATNARNRTNWVGSKLLGAFRLPNGRFEASITADGIAYRLGIFDTEDAAHAAYKAARQACAAAEEKARLTVLEQMQARRAA